MRYSGEVLPKVKHIYSRFGIADGLSRYCFLYANRLEVLPENFGFLRNDDLCGVPAGIGKRRGIPSWLSSTGIVSLSIVDFGEGNRRRVCLPAFVSCHPINRPIGV